MPRAHPPNNGRAPKQTKPKEARLFLLAEPRPHHQEYAASLHAAVDASQIFPIPKRTEIA